MYEPCSRLATATNSGFEILTRNVDEENQQENPRNKLLSQLPRRLNSFVYQPAFAADTQGIQHIEGVVSQPSYEARVEPTQAQDEV